MNTNDRNGRTIFLFVTRSNLTKCLKLVVLGWFLIRFFLGGVLVVSACFTTKLTVSTSTFKLLSVRFSCFLNFENNLILCFNIVASRAPIWDRIGILPRVAVILVVKRVESVQYPRSYSQNKKHPKSRKFKHSVKFNLVRRMFGVASVHSYD